MHVELVDPQARPQRARRSPASAPARSRPARRRASRCDGRRQAAIAPVIRALDEHGVEVEFVEVETPTLDDVFPR